MSQAGWVIQVKTQESEGERKTRWAVAESDWFAAQGIATAAQGIDPANPRTDVRVLNTRALRQATETELEGLTPGEARSLG